jgi:hypothetical protein
MSDLEPRFICLACGNRGADVRPDFNWECTIEVRHGSIGRLLLTAMSRCLAS